MTAALLLAWLLLSPLVAVFIGASIRFAYSGALVPEVAAATDESDCPGAAVEELAAA
jgi:hypothetical protein